MAASIYLADTSVYVLQGRHPHVRDRFIGLLADGRLIGCQMTALEYLNNAADPAGYEVLWEALHDRIAAVTGQPTEWVVERGSL